MVGNLRWEVSKVFQDRTRNGECHCVMLLFYPPSTFTTGTPPFYLILFISPLIQEFYVLRKSCNKTHWNFRKPVSKKGFRHVMSQPLLDLCLAFLALVFVLVLRILSSQFTSLAWNFLLKFWAVALGNSSCLVCPSKSSLPVYTPPRSNFTQFRTVCVGR